MRELTMKPQNSIIALAWYRPEQWALLRAVSADTNVLEDAYEAWLSYASRHQRELESRGFSVRRVDVEVTELARWCEQSGRPVDATARAAFAQQKLRKSL